MSVEIVKVNTARQRRMFIKFPEKLYRHNPFQVPNLVFDEQTTLNPAKTPASSFCKFELYLAYKDGELVGRAAAIINSLANERWGKKQVRIGWVDFIDDREVSKALVDAVIAFGKANGMEYIVGPLGFTDLDPEGMLIEGFDRVSTMPAIYNFPYYPEHFEALGFRKDADWKEFRIPVPDQLPEKMIRVSKIVEQRAGVHVRKLTRRIVRKEDYGRKIFKMINETYKDLYEYTILPEELADKYLGFYLSILDLRYVSIVENEKGELVAFSVTMPSLAKALQKSRGELFPFGWIPLVRDMFFRHSEGVELLLIGVRPDYRGQGLNSLLFVDMFTKFKKWGIKWAESNPELELNAPMTSHWDIFEHEQHKRRRSYIMDI